MVAGAYRPSPFSSDERPCQFAALSGQIELGEIMVRSSLGDAFSCGYSRFNPAGSKQATKTRWCHEVEDNAFDQFPPASEDEIAHLLISRGLWLSTACLGPSSSRPKKLPLCGAATSLFRDAATLHLA